MANQQLLNKVMKSLGASSKDELCAHTTHQEIGIYKKEDLIVIPAKSYNEYMRIGNPWDVRKNSSFIEVGQDGEYWNEISKEYIQEYHHGLRSLADELPNVREVLKK